jgi:hypothetical protein
MGGTLTRRRRVIIFVLTLPRGGQIYVAPISSRFLKLPWCPSRTGFLVGESLGAEPGGCSILY